MELAQFRRNNPGDDLMTSIVNAEVDGHRLTDEEVGAFLILLASAGNDTSKQTTTHAMMALVDNPAQRAWLMEDFDNRIGPAVEEFVRWASPVMQFARFATEDTEINGQPVEAGEKVGLFYCSANRDEAAFADPGVFDLGRSPNPHLGFGGGGPHFCLGNQLAKTELRNLFRELLTRLTHGRVRRARPAVQQLRPRRQTLAGPRPIGVPCASKSTSTSARATGSASRSPRTCSRCGDDGVVRDPRQRAAGIRP